MGIYWDDSVFYGFRVPMELVLPAGKTVNDYRGYALGDAVTARLCEMADADPALAAAFASEHRPRKILVEYNGGARFVYEQSRVERSAEHGGREVAVRPVPSDAQRANALAIATSMLPSDKVEQAIGVWAIRTEWVSHDPGDPYSSITSTKRLSP